MTYVVPHLPYDEAAQNVRKSALSEIRELRPDEWAGFLDRASLYVGTKESGVEYVAPKGATFIVRGDGDIIVQSSGTVFAHRLTHAPAGERWRWSSSSQLGNLPEEGGPRVKLAHGEAVWPQPIFGWPVYSHEAEDRIRITQEQGVKVLGYVTLQRQAHPEALARADEWSATGVSVSQGITSYFADYQAPGWLTWLRDALLAEFERSELDGLYLDHASITRRCGVRGPDPWPYMELFAFLDQLRDGMRSIRPGALLAIHDHGQPVSLREHCDAQAVGEALYEAQLGPGNPDYLAMPRGTLTRLTHPQPGGRCYVLPLVDRGSPHDRTELTQRLVSAAIIDGVHLWAARSDQMEIHRAWTHGTL